MNASLITMFLICLLFSAAVTAQTKKDSLQKIAWIEGNWQGMDGSNPFYEIYRFKNDTTLVITSYNWNGKDSSGTSISTLTRHNGKYYLGDSLNYKVTSISDASIIMLPNHKAYNAIVWRKVDADNWEAILETRQKMKTYSMKRIAHFK